MGQLTATNPAEVSGDIDIADRLRSVSVWRALLILDMLFLATSASFTLLAPAGNWRNRTLGVDLWHNGDPGSGYIVGALYVFTSKTRIFVGHPGLTLELVVGSVARATYRISRLAGGQDAYFDFWARNIRNLFVLAALLTSALHVV